MFQLKINSMKKVFIQKFHLMFMPEYQKWLDRPADKKKKNHSALMLVAKHG